MCVSAVCHLLSSARTVVVWRLLTNMLCTLPQAGKPVAKGNTAGAKLNNMGNTMGAKMNQMGNQMGNNMGNTGKLE
jgi:hypothetical protein